MGNSEPPSPFCTIDRLTHFPRAESTSLGIFQRFSPFSFFPFLRIFNEPKSSVVSEDHKLSIEKQAREKIAEGLRARRAGGNLSTSLEVFEVLEKAFLSGEHGPLNNLRENRAQVALDTMHEVELSSEFKLEDNPTSEDGRRVLWSVHWLLNRRLQKLACEALLLPNQMVKEGVTSSSLTAFASGASADLFHGTYGGNDVGIKYLRSFYAAPTQSKASLKKFYREAILWYNIDHRNVLKFLGVCEPNILNKAHGMCMVLDWAENRDLRHHLDDLLQKKPIPDDDYANLVNQWLYGIAQGMECLHSFGVVHGDLRGVNVLINSEGIVLLADFGLSVIADIGVSFTENHGIACVPWTSPELLTVGREGGRPTFKSDMYAFGCTCIELYTNASPFGDMGNAQIIFEVMKGKRPKRPKGKLSDELWELVIRCWKQKSKKRPTATETVNRLSEIFPLLTRQA